jgi:hypothetical protein
MVFLRTLSNSDHFSHCPTTDNAQVGMGLRMGPFARWVNRNPLRNELLRRYDLHFLGFGKIHSPESLVLRT